MRTRETINDEVTRDIVAAREDSDVHTMSRAYLRAILETNLDIRELLQKGKRGIKVIEMGLTEKEEKLLEGLEEH